MSQQPERVVINVISGKGGTGKTLLACVLADMLGNHPNSPVVVIDLDIFVRGLTSLLYFHQEEKLHVAGKKELVVANFFVDKLRVSGKTKNLIAIRNYRSFGVVPAVGRIDEVLDSPDISPNNLDEACMILRNILAHIPHRYRFVILDSRAGYDELVAATHSLSTVSICVEEQDPISRVTADNLVAQLRHSKTPLFRLVNKGRGISSERDLDRGVRSIADLGVIPFDMDVLNNFGSKNFWDEIARSLYRSAVARAWNRLSSKLEFGVELTPPRISPVGNEFLEAYIGMLSSRDRVFFLYGILIGVFGITYGLFGSELVHILRENPVRFAMFIMGIAGILFALFSFLRPRKN